MTEWPPSLGLVLSVVWAVYLLLLGGWIVLQKRSPVATLGWLLALGALPYVGFFVYYLFGPQRIERRRHGRQASRRAVEQQRAFWRQRMPPEALAQATGLGRLIYNATGYPPALASSHQLLSGGEAAFEAIFAAIGQARHTVHLEYYIYEPDQTGTALRDLLAAKAREGVRVRLLLDALGSARVTRRWMRPLLEAGGELAFFHATSLRRFRPVLNLRTHRKIVVVDSHIGLTGGINVTDEQDQRRCREPYHDLHLRLEGQAVYWLEQMFWEDWHYSSGQMPDAMPPPPEPPVSLAGAQMVQIIPAGPDYLHAPILRAKVTAMEQARQRIWLTTPYFVPDEPALFALVSAALRGVDVRILVPRRSDNLVVTLAARSWFGELLRVGVRIWEYGPCMLHSKSLLIDDCYSFVGTDNFDNRSFRLNFEVAVLNYETQAAEALARQFEADLVGAEELIVRQPRRKVWRRFPEALARLASPLL
ncbi:MAG: cardiolipin synthase [Comamonas sp.]